MSTINTQNKQGFYPDMDKALTQAANTASREGAEELGPNTMSLLTKKNISLFNKALLVKNRWGKHSLFLRINVPNTSNLEEVIASANEEAKQKLRRLRDYAESVEKEPSFNTDDKYKSAKKFKDEHNCDYFGYLTGSKEGSENGNIEFDKFEKHSLNFARDPKFTSPFIRLIIRNSDGKPETVVAGHHHKQLLWLVNGVIPDDCIEMELSPEQQEVFLKRFRQPVEVNDVFSHEWIPVQSGTISLGEEIEVDRVQFIVVDDSGEYAIMGTTHENNGDMLFDFDPNRPKYEAKYCGGTVDQEDLETGQKEESP